MSDTPLTTEERLYSLSKQKLWNHVSEEQHRYMLESEAYDLWLVATESCREEIQKALQKGITSVIFLRCKKHYNVPVQNENEFSGGECGGCIAEQRDALLEALKVAINTVECHSCERETGTELPWYRMAKKAIALCSPTSPKPNEIQRAQG